jgi:hypothetical protein
MLAGGRSTTACADLDAVFAAGEQLAPRGGSRAPVVTLICSQKPVFAPTEQVPQPAVGRCLLLGCALVAAT